MIGTVYVVTDAEAQRPVIDQARAAARGGAWAVQLRDKTASDAEMAEMTRVLLDEIAPLGVRVFVNDRIDVAQATGADLHIGQGDGDPRTARARIGPEALLGVSVETLAQCAAIPDCVDYIGAGPLRTTATKPDAAQPIGFDGLARIVAASPVATFAIGGLGEADIPKLKATGAAGLAVVTAVTRAHDPEAATRALFERWRHS